MLEYAKLYTYRRSYCDYITAHCPELIPTIVHGNILSLPNKNFIQDLMDNRVIVKRQNHTTDDDLISLNVRAVIMSDRVLYLADESFGTLVDKVSLPGGQLGDDSQYQRDYGADYVRGQLCKGINIQFLKGGYETWSFRRDVQCDIEKTLEYLNIKSRVDDNWYIGADLSTRQINIYVPVYVGGEYIRRLIEFDRCEYNALCRAHSSARSLKQVKQIMNYDTLDDIRLTNFEYVIQPLFNTFPQLAQYEQYTRFQGNQLEI